MPNYAFRATDRNGNTVDGAVFADSEALAANQIGQMGYGLVSLQPSSGPQSVPEAMVASAAGIAPPAPAYAATAQPRSGAIDLTQPIAAMPIAAATPLTEAYGSSGDP